MKYFLFYGVALFIGSFSWFSSLAQEKSANGFHYPEWNLRTNLYSWLDYDAGPSLGAGIRWSDRFSAAIEPTWIFYNGFVTDPDQVIIPRGIRIRADLKYYLSRRKNRGPEFYIAPEGHFKSVRTQKEDLFGINCQGGQCAYFQKAVYTESKKETGAMLLAGMITKFPFVRNRRWFLEFYGGVGAKNLTFKELNLPVGGSFVSPPNRDFLNFRFAVNRENISRPMLPGGLRLFYILQKK